MLTPPALAPGDTVLMVSTARRVAPDDVAAAEAALRTAGYDVQRGPHLLAAHHQWAGTDAQRLSDLQWALDHPTARAVICARGGYGTSRLIEALDLSGIVARPKWVVGFSDVTALHAALLRAGVASLHGPMAISWAERFGLEADSLHGVLEALAGQPPEFDFAPVAAVGLRPGRAQGRLMGGNLSLVVHLLGSADALPLEGALLVLEDLDEYTYHIDRMLLQLRRAGAFARVAGLVVGDFIDLKEKPESPFGAGALEMIAEHTARWGCPVGVGFGIGHGRRNLPWVHGAWAELSVEPGRVRLSYRPEPGPTG